MPDQPNVLEVLQAMQQQQQRLQETLLLKDMLDEAGLPAAEKAKIRAQFRESFDVVKVQEAIDAVQARLAEAAGADEPAPTLPAVRGVGYDYQKVKDRWNVFREGQLLGNFGTKAEADAAVARDQRTREASATEAQKAAEERYALQLKLTECKLMLKERLQESGLPLTAQEKLEKQFAGRTFDEAELQEAINDTWDMLSPLIGTGTIMLPGQERGLRQAKIIESDWEKKCKAFDGFWAGQDLPGADGSPVKRFRSLQEAYMTITGRPWNAWQVMRESNCLIDGHRYDSNGRYGEQAGRITEAITTTTWAQIMGDSITRRMLAEYRVAELNLWRQVVSEISNITSFRTQRRMRLGGYGLLPVVAEGISYTALPSPTDQEASYAIQKRGGLESMTLEAIANDDVGVIRRIPRALGRAAAHTLQRGVFNLLLNNTALTFDDDTTAVFTAGHGNYRAANNLTPDGLDLAIQDMAQQTAYGNSTEFLGIRPRFLLHPSALWRMAYKLTNTQRGEPSTAENDANPFLQLGIQPLQLDYWTDSDAWILVANPNDIPTIEVGFFNGAEDPELFVADNESDGGSSRFEADKTTWKIRHVWGVVVLDYRGVHANNM